MKVLGISGSPRKNQATDQLVREVLNATGMETEFVSLAGKRIGPCIACLGCVSCPASKEKDRRRTPNRFGLFSFVPSQKDWRRMALHTRGSEVKKTHFLLLGATSAPWTPCNGWFVGGSEV